MRAFLCFSLLLLLPTQAAVGKSSPVVAIIIDDIGNNLALDERAVALPGPVACAFLPDTPYAAKLAREAHRNGKEVLLHLPLEAIRHEKLGPGGLTLHMTEGEFIRTVQADLAAIPDVNGVNNHMGSLMTQHPGDMAWLMGALRQDDGLFFVDSRTTPRTVAYNIAQEYGVPATWRDVFLDDVQTTQAILAQLQHLIRIAKRRGTAVAIGHPYAVTLYVLRKQLPRLEDAGVRLVSLRTIIARQAEHAAPKKVTRVVQQLKSPSTSSGQAGDGASLTADPAQKQHDAAEAGGTRAHP
ncbi:MAG TPA: divergent polysaccharide deacetylase family protein [Gammaproteobacteria bacterium]|nr:divergent polysaccharide deacetylase family protein [Gammaproteobacteria bacterium]